MGAAPILSLLAQVRGSNWTAEAVLAATAELLRRYPLLRSVVTEGRSQEPKYTIIDIEPRQVVEERDSEGMGAEQLLGVGLEEGKTLDLEKGPLWKVILFNPSIGAPQRLLLCINHTICDGVGARNLLADILTLLRTPSASEAVKTLPPSQDTSVDLRPGYGQLVGTIYAEVIAPRLPSFLRAKPRQPTWPNPPPVRPIDQPTALRRLVVSPEIVSALKLAGRAHRVSTLQPLLHASTLASFVIVLSMGDPTITLPPLDTDTPTSLRSSELGHPHATGNYVAVAAHSDSLRAFRPQFDSRFWDLARRYGSALADPATIAYGRGIMGMMKHIPDGPVNAEGKSAWETFFGAKAMAENPYSAATSTSNLGVLPATGWEGDGMEVCWAQTGSAFGQGIVTNVRWLLLFGESSALIFLLAGSLDQGRQFGPHVQLEEGYY